MSVFFNNARAAGGVTSLVMMLMSVLNIALQQGGATSALCWALSIFSPIPYTLAIADILQKEGAKTGIQFSNVSCMYCVRITM
jgi:hypothetical protein